MIEAKRRTGPFGVTRAAQGISGLLLLVAAVLATDAGREAWETVNEILLFVD
ncbi:MAG: hypothetical protein OXI56_08835 [bacterium]|nr:hypothetical protein [bacterium]MDE0601882.1 hypothetical protein [bacterium]